MRRWALNYRKAGLEVCRASHPGVVQRAAHPCRRVAAAIRGRFLAGESVDDLAADYDLPAMLVLQLVRRKP